MIELLYAIATACGFIILFILVIGALFHTYEILSEWWTSWRWNIHDMKHTERTDLRDEQQMPHVQRSNVLVS